MECIKETIAGAKVQLYYNKSTPQLSSKLTFFLSGACISLDEYDTVIKTLVEEKNHIVIGYFINVLSPLTNNHRSKAQQVVQIFDAIKGEKRFPFSIPTDCTTYNLIGHSVGGKISLLIASTYDVERVDNVIALDPVDQNLPCFTNVDKDKNESLLRIKNRGNVVITNTGGGPGIKKEHNGEAIWKQSKTKCNDDSSSIILVQHEYAGHMAYCDNGGGKLGRFLMSCGTMDANRMALEDIIHIIMNSL